MSFDRQRDGFFKPSLYLFSNQKEYSKQLRDISLQAHFHSENLIPRMITYHMSMTKIQQKIMQEACKRVAASFMLEKSDYAELLLSEEEYEKATALLARRQYDSKLLQKITTYFSVLLDLSLDKKDTLSIYFYSDLIREYQTIEEELVGKDFAPLKKKISTIASGVKASCYLENQDARSLEVQYLSERWNERLKSKIGYDYNQQFSFHNRMSTLMHPHEHHLMTSIWQQCLLDDFDFWKKHKDFSVFSFLKAVEKKNSPRHAEKIFDYMCDALMQIDNIKLIIQNNLPLYMIYKDILIENLEKQAHKFTFAGLRPYCNIEALSNEAICVPMSIVSDEKLSCGKAVFTDWICKYNYPCDEKKVLAYIENEVEHFVSGESRKNNDIAVILDGPIFRYEAENTDRRAFTAYFPNCFSKDNIFNRAYMTAYAVTLLTNDEKTRFNYLNRIYDDLLNSIEEKIGICTAQKTDFISRDEQYSLLKKKMEEFDIEISDAYKQEYIIALLDRETALLKEAERFPELEQLGDAVYGFAVAEYLFYQPISNLDYAKSIEKYTCASAQIELSKHFGFDKFYLHTGISAKYEDFGSLYFSSDPYILSQEEKQTKNSEKYLADSLEMLIGVLAIDKGIHPALDFTKHLLKEHFKNDFGHREIRDTPENRRTVTDTDYWDKILPSLSESVSGDNLYLSFAFNKLILALSLGTSDKSKRNYITYSYIGLSHKTKAWAFFDYLHKGLDYVLSEYKDGILEDYNTYEIKN